jgi:hypothetical protein
MASVFVRFGLVGRVLRVNLKEYTSVNADLTGALVIVELVVKLAVAPYTSIRRRAAIYGQPTDGTVSYTFTAADFTSGDFSAGVERNVWWVAVKNRGFSSGFDCGFGTGVPPAGSDTGLYPDGEFDHLVVTSP